VEYLGSLLSSVYPNWLGVCHQEKLGVYLGACSGVNLGASSEIASVHIVMQAERVESNAIGSGMKNMPGSVHEDVPHRALHQQNVTCF